MGKRRRRARNKAAAAAVGIAVAVLAAVLQPIPAPPDLSAEHPATKSGHEWQPAAESQVDTTHAYWHWNTWRCDNPTTTVSVPGGSRLVCQGDEPGTGAKGTVARPPPCQARGTDWNQAEHSGCPRNHDLGGDWTFVTHRTNPTAIAGLTEHYCQITRSNVSGPEHCGTWAELCPAGSDPAVRHRHTGEAPAGASGWHLDCVPSHEMCRAGASNAVTASARPGGHHTARQMPGCDEPVQCPTGQHRHGTDPCHADHDPPACIAGVSSEETRPWTPTPNHGHAAVQVPGCVQPALADCPSGQHSHAAAVPGGHQGCRAAHTAPSCTWNTAGAWSPGHGGAASDGHTTSAGMRVCVSVRSFCESSGAGVWNVTVDRRSWDAGYPESSLPKPLAAGYDRNRIPAGRGLAHSQFTPSATIGRTRDPVSVTLAPGAWTAAAVNPPQARWGGSVRAVDYAWNRDYTGGRFRSCGRITWGAPEITWQSDNPLLVLGSANGGRIRWNATECPSARTARLTVNAAWRITLDHYVDAYDRTYDTHRRRTWTIRCGTAQILDVCQRADLPRLAAEAGSGLSPLIYQAQDPRAQNRWRGSIMAQVYGASPRLQDVASWNSAPRVLRLPGEMTGGTRDGEPPLVLLYTPVAASADSIANQAVGRWFYSDDDGPYSRLRTRGLLSFTTDYDYYLYVDRSDGTRKRCGYSTVELRSLTWALTPDPASRASGRMIPLTLFPRSGLRRAQTSSSDAADLPRTCTQTAGWAPGAGGSDYTNLGYADCAGEAFFEIDLECGPGADLSLTAVWTISVWLGGTLPAVTGDHSKTRTIRFEPPGAINGCVWPGS